MSGGRSSKRRAQRQKRNARQGGGARSAQASAQTRRRDRVRRWLSSANKLVLAAIGTGIAGLITTAVVAIPHQASNLINPPPKPPPTLAIVGSASPGVQPTQSAGKAGSPQYLGVLGGPGYNSVSCSLGGVYVVPGAVHLPKTVSTADVTRMLRKAGYAGDTSGSYLLQPSAGQTMVLTSLHAVLLRRVPAKAETETVLYVQDPCPGAPPTIFNAAIDLDAADPAPKLSLINEMAGTTTPVRSIADVATQDQPVQIYFDGTTARDNVTWKLRLDYVVNGKQESTYLPSAGPPFETDAIVGTDPAYTLAPDNGDTWIAQPGRPS